MISMIVITILAVLYGLAWHNQPARQPAVIERAQGREQRDE